MRKLGNVKCHTHVINFKNFITFIDENTHFVIFPIKRKPQVPDLSIDFVEAVQMQCDC